MKTKEKKTLKDLIEENVTAEDFKEEILELPLDKIKPNPYQPRYVFDNDDLKELALSIKEHGVIQPIIVKKMGANYVIIAGERRFRASKLAHQSTIPAIVRQYEKSKMIELALIENLQREDLSAVEEAKAYNQIMRELDLTQKEVAERVGKTRSYVTNMLGLLNLPENVLKLVDDKKITMGHARALSKLLDKERINYIANQIIQKNLSVREVERLVIGEEKKNPSKNIKSKAYTMYEQNLGLHFKSKVRINEKKVTFSFKNEDEMISFVNNFLKEN